MFTGLLLSRGLSALSVIALVQGAALAAEPADQVLEEVVVTGSNIHGEKAAGTPVVTLDREAIEATGAADTAAILRTLPNALTIGTDETNLRSTAQAGGLNVGFGTGINLRGVGSSSTLTLFDGYRVPPSGQRGQFFEISSIPPAALGRIEVVADGASAVYGSDAVAGTANLVLRKDVNGAETSVRYGAAANNAQRDFSQLLGKTWATGHVMVAFDYNHRDSLSASQRTELYNDNQTAFGGTDLRSNNSAAGNVVVGTTYYPILHNAGVNALGAGVAAVGANKQSNWLGFTVLPSQTRNSTVLSFNQQVGSRFELFAEGFYSERTFRQQNAAQSYASTVPSTNPFFLRPAGSTATSVTVNYSFINDLGPTILTGGARNYLAVAGARADLGGGWKASLFLSQGHSRDTRLSTGVNTCAISDPGPTSAAHRAVCGNTTGVLFDTNPATSLNVFGGGGNNNSATLAKILGYSLFGSNYRLRGTGVKADGPLFSLPSGQVRAALGVDYYDHKQQNDTPNNTAGADINTLVSPDLGVQHRTVKALFAELAVPIVGTANAIPGIQELRLSLAGRAESYSDFGSTRNPKVGFDWKPLGPITVHGTYGTSFRAPTLADSNANSTVGINIVQFREANGTTITQGLQIVGGNPALRPETAKTYSLGFDVKPAALPGLVVSLNYFNIKYKDRIGTPATELSSSFAQEALYSAYVTRRPGSTATVLGNGFCSGKTFNACVAEQFARPFYSNSITDPNQVQFVIDQRATNAGQLNTSGYDLQVDYAWRDTAIGDITAGASVTDDLHYITASVPGGPQTDRINTVDNPLKLRARFDLGWHRGAYRGNLFINYNNSYDNLTVSPTQGVSAYTTVDLTLGYKSAATSGLFQGVSLSLNVQNVLDKSPPLALVGNQLFDSLTGSALGRNGALQLSKRW